MQHFFGTYTPCRPDFMFTMSDAEKAGMFDHVQYMTRLLNEGKLLLAGPCMDGSQAILVIRADSMEAAKQIVDADPAVTHGLVTYRLHPFHPGFQEGKAPDLLAV